MTRQVSGPLSRQVRSEHHAFTSLCFSHHLRRWGALRLRGGFWSCVHRPGGEVFSSNIPEAASCPVKPDVHLCTLSGGTLSVLRSATVIVRHKDTVCCLPLLVVQGDGASLLGRNWFALLGIGVAGIHQTSTGLVTLQLRQVTFGLRCRPNRLH